MSMPPDSTEGAARAEQAARVEEIEIESVPPKTGRQPAGPDAGITLVATAPLRRPPEARRCPEARCRALLPRTPWCSPCP